MSGRVPEPSVDFSLQGKVAIVTINNPAALNALSEDMAKGMVASLRRAEECARAVVITGAGRAFCSGVSLAPDSVDPGVEGYDAGQPLEDWLNPLVQAIRELGCPVVSAVNGPAAGFGASIALASDFIVAAEDAYFLEAFRHIGLVPDGGSFHALVRTLGRARANEMMMLGKRIPARQAAEWGLINRAVPATSLMTTALDLASELAAGPTAALRLIKRLSWGAADGDFDDMLTQEREAQRDAGLTEDHREGLAAFREKRDARFAGK